MNKISVLALFLLVVAAAAGCQSANVNEEWMRRHPPVEFTPSGRSSELQPDISSQPVREEPPVTTVEPTTDLPTPKDAGRPEWRFKGTRKWTYIIIHHSATERGSAESFDRSHRRRGWAGLGYHFVIGNGEGAGNGVVEVGPRWKKQGRGAHAGVDYYNEHGIGICLVGNFEKTRPTEKQIAALVELIRWLQKEYNIPRKNVQGHGDIKDTLCPGKYFPMERVRKLIRP